jgi:hypothetical protein
MTRSQKTQDVFHALYKHNVEGEPATVVGDAAAAMALAYGMSAEAERVLLAVLRERERTRERAS